jgi:hypothetical protein
MNHFEAVGDDGPLYDEVDELIEDGPKDLSHLDKPDAVYRDIAWNRSGDKITNTQDAPLSSTGSSLLGDPIDPEKIKP